MTQELRKLAERLSPDRTTVLRIDAEQAGEAILELLDRLEKAEKEPEITPAMIQAAEEVEDLYRRGTPHTWGKVFRAMWRAMEASK